MACGDRLEVQQRIVGTTVFYMHHGVDVGDGTVVHARPDDFRNPFGGGRVVRTSHAEFAAGRPVRVTVDPPARFSAAEVVARALAHVGREGYSPLVDNCEHFTTWCATGRRASRQAEIVLSRIRAAVARGVAATSARAAVGVGGRIAFRTAVGTTVRMGLRTLVPAAVAAEVAALVVEWRAHQAGRPAADSRRAGEAAGMATSAAACGLAGAAAGPAGLLGGVLAGAALWATGSVAAAAAAAAAQRPRGPGQRR